MNSLPKRKWGGDMTALTKVSLKDVKKGKFYYVRAVDRRGMLWGATHCPMSKPCNEEYIAKVDMMDDRRVYMKTFYTRVPPGGKWGKLCEVCGTSVYWDSPTNEKVDDYLTFYIDTKQMTRKNPRKRAAAANTTRRH